jgi:hypothetical protein
MVTSRNSHKDMSRIPVAYLILGWENNRKALIDFFRNAKNMINVLTDASAPPITSKLSWLIKEILAARTRGVRSRLITDITRDNLTDCKDRITQIDAVRHFAGIEVVFMVSESEYMALVPSSAPREEIEKIQLIYSDSESVVGIKQRIFNALWDRAIPAQSRIDELEGKVPGEAITTQDTRKVIDSIHVCRDCNRMFVYEFEVMQHKKASGHSNYGEHAIA